MNQKIKEEFQNTVVNHFQMFFIHVSQMYPDFQDLKKIFQPNSKQVQVIKKRFILYRKKVFRGYRKRFL